MKNEPTASREPARKITLEALRAARLQRQHLVMRLSAERAEEVIADLCGVNAQLTSAMELALRARLEGLTFTDIDS
ncbi:MAG TPA: hypothetical protein VGJ97_08695, partial [Anaerolineaceae bacterium]